MLHFFKSLAIPSESAVITFMPMPKNYPMEGVFISLETKWIKKLQERKVGPLFISFLVRHSTAGIATNRIKRGDVKAHLLYNAGRSSLLTPHSHSKVTDSADHLNKKEQRITPRSSECNLPV